MYKCIKYNIIHVYYIRGACDLSATRFSLLYQSAGPGARIRSIHIKPIRI